MNATPPCTHVLAESDRWVRCCDAPSTPGRNVCAAHRFERAVIDAMLPQGATS